MEPRLSGERESLKAPAAGGLIWCTIAMCAGVGKTHLGVIELLFLLAPLVIVPLGLHVLNRIEVPCDSIASHRLARWSQPIAALFGVTAFFFPAGRWAATLATPWLAVCIFLGLFAARRILRSRARPLDALCFAIAQIYLPVGAIWFVLSRYGARPLGFYEPIVLLTAVHFHYAGFAASVLTGSVMERTRNGTRLPLLLQRLIVLF